MKIQRFSEKTPDETVLLEFDFSKLCSAISSAEFTVTQLSPSTVDPGLANILEGVLVITGAKVQQKVKAGLNKHDYQVMCEAQTTEGFGQVFQLSGVLPVRTPRE